MNELVISVLGINITMFAGAKQSFKKSFHTKSRVRRGAVVLLGVASVVAGGIGVGAVPSTGATAQAQLPALPKASGSSDLNLPAGPVQTALDMAPRGCAAHIVVNVPGGANTTSNLPERLPTGANTRQVGEGLRHRHPGQVVDRYVSYRSTPGGARSYEQTRDKGYSIARGLIEREAAACPNATFSLVGYSMGADIASRIVNDIANGRGPVAANHLDSAVLIANPNRSAKGEVAQAGGAPRTDGAFGEYRGGYGQLGGRVLEICRRGDLVCDTPHSAAPIAKAFARSSIIAGFAPWIQAQATVNRLSPQEQAVFYANLPMLFRGMFIHTNYDAANASGTAIGYIERHFGAAK